MVPPEVVDGEVEVPGNAVDGVVLVGDVVDGYVVVAGTFALGVVVPGIVDEGTVPGADAGSVPVLGTLFEVPGVVTGLVVVGVVDLSGTVPGGTVVGCVFMFGVVVLPGCVVVLPGFEAPGNVEGCNVLPGTVVDGCVVVEPGVLLDDEPEGVVVVCPKATADPKIVNARRFNLKVFMILYVC